MRAVVFDLDGTLIDGYRGITTALNAARAAFGMTPLTLDDVRGRVGHGLPTLMRDVVGEARVSEGIALFRGVYDRVCVEQTTLIDGVANVLADLGARGIRMSVASNKPASYSRRILRSLHVLERFDAVEGPDTVGAPKPEPAMIRSCLAAMRVPPSEALYVGDMTLDADAGARAGVPVVLVASGSCTFEQLRATGCPVLHTLRELAARVS